MDAALHLVRSKIVRPILENPNRHEWQVQGLGMLRTYIDENTRLHIWNNQYHYAGDSGWHTHPWDFCSFIVCGEVTNRKYLLRTEPKLLTECTLWKPYMRQHIICGPGGCAMSEPEKVRLFEAVQHIHRSGESYRQSADEIHTTETKDGTVSIITRRVVHEDGSADIFYPEGSKWTSAEARPATEKEIYTGCALALNRLNLEEGT